VIPTGDTFKIYTAANETTQFVTAYDQAVEAGTDAIREGDDVIARRIDANTIEVLVVGNTAALVTYTSTDNGVSFTRSNQTMTGAGLETPARMS
jgi:hypothetical protein